MKKIMSVIMKKNAKSISITLLKNFLLFFDSLLSKKNLFKLFKLFESFLSFIFMFFLVISIYYLIVFKSKLNLRIHET